MERNDYRISPNMLIAYSGTNEKNIKTNNKKTYPIVISEVIIKNKENNNHVTSTDNIDTEVEIKALFKLFGHTFWINSLINYSKNRNLLTSCSDDKSIRFWDLNERKEILKINAHKNVVNSICEIKINKKYRGCIASASFDHTIKIWKIDIKNINDKKTNKKKTHISVKEKLLVTLKGHKTYLDTVKELPNGCLISKTTNGKFRIWNIDKKTNLYLLELPCNTSTLSHLNPCFSTIRDNSSSFFVTKKDHNDDCNIKEFSFGLKKKDCYQLKENELILKLLDKNEIKEIRHLNANILNPKNKHINKLIMLKDKIFFEVSNNNKISIKERKIKMLSKTQLFSGTCGSLELPNGNFIVSTNISRLIYFNPRNDYPSKHFESGLHSTFSIIYIDQNFEWSIKNHFQFPERFQKFIKFLLWINNQKKSFIYILPKEILLYELFSFL